MLRGNLKPPTHLRCWLLLALLCWNALPGLAWERAALPTGPAASESTSALELSECALPDNSQAYLYTGEQMDPDLGMYYLRARYYQPSIGRFWNMDSYEGTPFYSRSLHKYAYVHGDPVNFADPSGHFEGGIGSFAAAFAIQGSIGAIISGGIDYAVHRSFAHAVKSAGWGFLIGGGAGVAVQGARVLLAARAAAAVAPVTVTTASTQLIASTTDGVLLGVIDSAGAVQLFRAGPGVFINGVEILGHAELVAAGVIRQGAAEGFSLTVVAGKVVQLRVNSFINAASKGYSIGVEKTAALIEKLDAAGAKVFGL